MLDEDEGVCVVGCNLVVCVGGAGLRMGFTDVGGGGGAVTCWSCQGEAERHIRTVM
jgi:hypothetical protein